MKPLFGEGDSGPLLARAPHQETPEFDITAMVDLVFLMNLYFLVTFITVALAEVNLPTAAHCEPLNSDEAVVLTVLGSLDGSSVSVTVGEGDEAVPIGETSEQAERIAAAVEQGVADGKDKVLIKAEKKVRLGDLFRVATAAAADGASLHVAVVESDGAP
jgi:biopolymer transport protein ExbD